MSGVLVAAGLLGLMGETHCVAMCGGVAAAPFVGEPEGRRAWPRALAYHGGRLATYAALGALAGAAGTMSERAPFPIGGLSLALRLLAGVLLALVALQLLGLGRGLSLLEALGRGPFAALARPIRARIGARPGALGVTLLGALWGLFPCGLVYAAIPVAALAQSAPGGALAMVAFGLGTLPAMLAVSLAASRALGLVKRRPARIVAGVVLLASAAVQLTVVGEAARAARAEPAACCAHEGAP